MRCCNATRRLPGLLAVVLVSSLLAAGAAARGQGDPPVGSITRVLQDSVYLRGRLASDQDRLYAGEVLRTSRPNGRAQFRLLLKQTVCNVFDNTRLVLRPHGNIGLQLSYGKVWCGTHHVRRRERMTGPGGLQISAKDPVFALTVSRKRTVVTVWQGLVTVSGTTGAAGAVLVGKHQQTTVPRGGNPGRATAAKLTKDDRGIATQLQAAVGAHADNTPPLTVLLSHPRPDTQATSATFTFATKEGGVVFECSLDRSGFHPCASPAVYPKIGDGDHVFAVQGIDPSGNVGPPVTYSWLVYSTPPQTTIVIPGEPVQIAVVVDTQSPSLGDLGRGIRNAVEMATGQRTIQGFPVQLNLVEAPALVTDDANAVADNAAVARQVISNPQNVAVIGHEASATFADVQPPAGACPSPTSDNALSIYQSYGIVTINGSTTNPCLPPIGPAVFNATAVPDPAFDSWQKNIQALPSDGAWRAAYEQQFGIAATKFADLYYDAANLLLERLQSVATTTNGNLVISRIALAQAVRATTGFCGVTGTLTLDAGGYRVDAVGSC